MCLLSSPEATGNRAMSSTPTVRSRIVGPASGPVIPALIREKLIAEYKPKGSRLNTP
jgi:hypothetical protein